ncbi:MAG: HAD family hydrolase [Clostridiales bacterium]|nr:HAD family hydrolase [Clostridiales bacterium]
MKPEKKAVIFDMDGTLWDALDNIVISWNESLSKQGIEDVNVKREDMANLVGKTMDKFAEFYFPDMPREKGLEILAVMEQYENDYLRENGGGLLGDVADVFEDLHEMGYMVGIVTNAQAGYAEAFMDHFGLRGQVDDFINYGDNLHGKADNIKLMIERNGIGQCWYVGDTTGDYEACQEAEVPFIYAAYGFGEVDAPVLRINCLEEIVELLDTDDK